jgi:Na+/proline symporter
MVLHIHRVLEAMDFIMMLLVLQQILGNIQAVIITTLEAVVVVTMETQQEHQAVLAVEDLDATRQRQVQMQQLILVPVVVVVEIILLAIQAAPVL